mmetsp:Transcript_5112/g.20980  ORF Transcript_5112/g.20980 Transcript_5112/m.20980 type:complete len:359 (+) Transcript_5112:1-1077(+)
MSLAGSDESPSRMRTAMSSTRSCLSSAEAATRMMDRMARRGDPPAPGSASSYPDGVLGEPPVTDPPETWPSSSSSESESHRGDDPGSARFIVGSSCRPGSSRFFLFPRLFFPLASSSSSSAAAAVACSAGPVVIVSHVFASPWNQLPPPGEPSCSTRSSSVVRVTRPISPVSPRRTGRMGSSSDVVVDALPVAPSKPGDVPAFFRGASTTTGEDVVDELPDSPASARDSPIFFFVECVVVVCRDPAPSRHASSHAPTNAPTNSSSFAAAATTAAAPCAPPARAPRRPRGTRRRARARAIWVAHDLNRAASNPPSPPVGTCPASAAPTMAPSSTPRMGSSVLLLSSWDAWVRDACAVRA